MTDEFTVDVAVEFNDDETVNIHLNNVAFDDVQLLLHPDFQEDFINGLLNARLA